jgi:hypothetical protein
MACDATKAILLMKVQSIVAIFAKPFGHWMLKSDHDVDQFRLAIVSITFVFLAFEFSFCSPLLPCCENMLLLVSFLDSLSLLPSSSPNL